MPILQSEQKSIGQKQQVFNQNNKQKELELLCKMFVEFANREKPVRVMDYYEAVYGVTKDKLNLDECENEEMIYSK